MLLIVTFRRGVNKINAVKFIRTVGKIGLKEAKELIETLQSPGTGFDIGGTLRLQVDPVFALSRLIVDRQTMDILGGSDPYITVATELVPSVVDLSK